MPSSRIIHRSHPIGRYFLKSLLPIAGYSGYTKNFVDIPRMGGKATFTRLVPGTGSTSWH